TPALVTRIEGRQVDGPIHEKQSREDTGETENVSAGSWHEIEDQRIPSEQGKRERQQNRVADKPVNQQIAQDQIGESSREAWKSQREFAQSKHSSSNFRRSRKQQMVVCIEGQQTMDASVDILLPSQSFIMSNRLRVGAVDGQSEC